MGHPAVAGTVVYTTGFHLHELRRLKNKDKFRDLVVWGMIPAVV